MSYSQMRHPGLQKIVTEQEPEAVCWQSEELKTNVVILARHTRWPHVIKIYPAIWPTFSFK